MYVGLSEKIEGIKNKILLNEGVDVNGNKRSLKVKNKKIKTQQLFL